MKLIIILMTTFLMQVNASGFAQQITLKNKNISLRGAFLEVKKQTGYIVLCESEVLNNAKPVTLDLVNVPLEDALKIILNGQDLEFSIKDKSIIVKEKEKPSVANRIINYFSNIDVTGKVTDTDGNPLRGASIKIKGTTTSTITNAKGEFRLTNVANDAILLFSYLGFETRELKASSNLTVTLLQSTSKLDEVQVVAYGTTTKRLSTGSVGTITAADIEKQPVNNILDAMIGRISGLQITQTSGVQGAAPKVNIRGQSSITAGTDPLFLLDGIPVTATQALQVAGALDNNSYNLLTSLNTDDIESVSVLKDADATAIYGSRGANGVILITTKHGKTGKLTTNIKASTGIQEVGHFMDFMNVDQYIAMREEAFANDGKVPSNDPTSSNYAPDLFDLGSYNKDITHNWQKEFLGGTAVNNDLGLTFSGGTENTKYFISTGYHKEGTVMPGDSKYIRKSFMGTINNTSENKKLNMEARTNYSESTLNLLPQDLVGSIALAPHYQIYNPDGSPNWEGGNFPLANTLQKYALPTKNLGINGLISYEFIPDLKLKATGGFTWTAVDMSLEQPLYSLNPQTATALNSTLKKQNTDNNNWIIEPQLEYSHSFNKHHINALLGATYQKSTSTSFSITGTNFSSDRLISNISSAGTKSNISSAYTPYAYNAFFGRLSYDFNQELLANVTFRRDGSSRFGEGKKFGNFGAVGLGWIFTQREWIKDKLPFLSYGKLRGSYGITGNDGIGDFLYLNTYYSNGNGYNGQPILYPAGIANPELRWETWKKLETALELGFLKDRILLTSAFYRNRSGNQLVLNNISTQAGFYYYQYNFPGVVQTQGYELELTTKNIQGAFKWNTSLTFSKSDNKLVSYPDFASSNYTFRLAIGQSLNVIKGYQLAGLNASGVPVYTLADGTVNTAVNQNFDRIILGDKDPMFGGISNDFSYKGFTFSFYVRYDRIVGTPEYYPNGTVGRLNGNFSTFVLGRWQKPGDEANTIIPRFTTNSGLYSVANYQNSDQLIVNRNIVRLSNAALSYSLPYSLISKLKLSKLQVYTNAQNLFVFDKHKDYELDPQTGNSSLPPLRTIVFGINASF